MRGEDHGHTGDENSSGGSVHVRVGRAMKEDQDLSKQAYERSPTRDKLECGCEVNAQARIEDTLDCSQKLMHHDEQELLSLWEVWHWDDNKGGRLDPEMCAKARRQEVECIRRHKT